VQAIYLGLISDSKGAFDLIAAVARLAPAARARLRLVMAGNGEAERARRAVVQKGLSDCIEVRDWLDPQQRDRLLGESQLFILPSYREGLPMSMLEAMAWGLAPICSPVGSIAEVISHGCNGMLVPAGNVDALANAISTLVVDDDQRASLGVRARSSVEPFAVDRYIDRLMDIYSAVARGASLSELSWSCKR
jgi:glycosyltransferase involved in cell wall biosynthesis